MTGNGPPRFCGGRLAAKAELDLAVLPLADARGTDEHDERATCPKVLFEPRLPGLSGGQRVAVEECGEARFAEPRPQRLRRGCVRPRVAHERRRSLRLLAARGYYTQLERVVTLCAWTEFNGSPDARGATPYRQSNRASCASFATIQPYSEWWAAPCPSYFGFP